MWQAPRRLRPQSVAGGIPNADELIFRLERWTIKTAVLKRLTVRQ